MGGNAGRPEYIKRRIVPLFAVSKIVTIHYFEFSGVFEGPRESHDFWEFVYVDKGAVRHAVEKDAFMLRQGDFLMIAPNRSHQLCACEGASPNVFIISFVCHSEALNPFRNRRGELPKQLRHYIAEIIGEARQTYDLAFNNPGMLELLSKESGLPGGQQMIQLLLQQLLIQLYRTLHAPAEAPAADPLLCDSATGNEIIDGMLRYIRRNAYSPVTSREVCKTTGYSSCYLSTLFHKSCGCSIVEYINRIKINEAKNLIRSGAHNFSEIAGLLCYSDQHYFSRVFRRVTGMSPSEYRKSVQL